MNNQQSPYLRREWKAVRLIKLRRNPICEHCFRSGTIRPTEVIHHIDGNPWNNSESNLKSLCRDCHEILHSRKAVASCDVNGLPLDPEHPWNKVAR